MKQSEKIGIDIFSGAGGLSLGAEMAGVQVRYAVEINTSAAQTFKLNHKSATIICKDIKDVSIADFNNIPSDVFIVMGGPPCQGFSMSNTRDRTMSNPKNHLFKEFVRIVGELKPLWFVFENVWGITNIEHGEVIGTIEKYFEDLGLGYKMQSAVLWANEHGVPQRRNRFFMVGNRAGINYSFPEKEEKEITVREAIEDLPILSNGSNFLTLPYRIPKGQASPYAQLMRGRRLKSWQNFVSLNNDLVIKRYSFIPQGGNWRDIPEDLMHNYADKSRCHSGIYRRLKYDSPSVVISNYRKSMLIHPEQDRGLSVREAARIQSFPDDFIFCGPISHIQQQIGNAVPPLLAKAVIGQIMSYYR